MLVCPGCGANLRYDIEKGKLWCSYCKTEYAPTDTRLEQRMAKQGQSDAEAKFNAKIFTCPQCGGEMYTTDVDATAYCSYCGASNVLQSRIEGIDAPKKIIPFTVTKKECIETFNKLAKKTLYAPREFRNGSGEEKLRPLYVPYRIFDLKLNGKAEMYGKASYIEGVMRVNEDRKIKCNLNANFENLAYDASAAFDDTLAEQIAPFEMDGARDFDASYLAGAYANIPDVDAEVYHQKALEYAAQKSIDALDEHEMFVEMELADFPDGGTVADHLPVQKESNYTALLPVWFMSFRRGNRIAYAAVNGETGKVYSDIPISLPAFWIGSLLTAIPIFVLLNLFVTLRPQTGLMVACFLALAGAIIYAGSYISILRRDKHLDDTGYSAKRSSGDGSGSADAGGQQVMKGVYRKTPDAEGKHEGKSEVKREDKQKGNRFTRWITGQENDHPKVKRGILYYAVRIFGMWPYVLIAIAAFVFVPPLFWAMVTVGCAVFCLRKTGGRISFWSGLLIVAAGAGFVMHEMPLVSDLWYYGGTAVILLILVIALTRLVHQYNLLATRPLPLLFKDGKVPGDGSKGKKANAAATSLLILVISGVLLQMLMPIGALASYTNAETGYQAVIDDQEDLLTDEEEAKLEQQLESLTVYGNAIFVSLSQSEEEETLDYAKKWYYQTWGNASGTVLMIDMGQRMIGLYSAGENYKVIGNEEGYVITDNIYTYASKGEYYECAASAFDQVGTLLEGGRIARPMKYINNALLALILAVLINYAIISAQAAIRRADRDAIFGNEDYLPEVKGSDWSAAKAVRVFSFTGLCTILLRFVLEAIIQGILDGDGGSSGGGSHGGGGGGGASGGGGSHRF